MKYRNLEPPYEPHGFGAVWRWAVSDRVWGRRQQAPQRVRLPTATPDQALLTGPAPSLTWVGHATFALRLAGRTILTDPNWSISLGPGLLRNVPPALPLAGLAVDVVVISHNHRDHLDAPTIDRLGPGPTYVVPEGLGRFFRRRGFPRVVELPWWGEWRDGDLRVAFVPSQHWSQRTPLDRNDSLWGGFVLGGDGRAVYFAGDTAYFGGFQEIGRRYGTIDAALLPIGAYEPEWFMRRQHMNPKDAVRAFLDLRARLLCAMHWGTFKLTDEPLDEPPRFLEEERRRAGVAPEQIWVPAFGETRRL